MGLILLKVLGVVLLAIAAALLMLRLNGKSRQKFEGADPALSAWMGGIDDDALLRQIAIPGSHAAGTRGILWAGETQTYTIAQQLQSGARYFDLRVHKKGDKYVIFHSILDGIEFCKVLDAIRDFIQSHPSEVILLDFQHFKGSQSEVRRLLLEELGARGLLIHNTTSLSPVEFIRGLTLGQARGKCVVFWGDRGEADSDFLFLRNDNECTCEGMCLDSYYLGQSHKMDTRGLIETAYPVYFKRLRQQQATGQDAMFVLQCQLTDGKFVRGPWSRERRHDPIISDYIRRLAQGEALDGINIILRDFITPQKCGDIIALNRCKGIMK